jgi:hypothetical protein
MEGSKSASATWPVTDVGQVRSLTLPATWQQGRIVKPLAGAGAYRQYHRTDAPESVIVMYYRGRRTALNAGKRFRNVLDKPPHVLTHTEARALGEIIRDRASAQDFKIVLACTQDWNGKRVLIIEGKWNELQHDTFAILIDSDGTGTAIQEIYFQAPCDQYPGRIIEAKRVLKSIVWK